jgi:hypothetical protein
MRLAIFLALAATLAGALSGCKTHKNPIPAANPPACNDPVATRRYQQSFSWLHRDIDTIIHDKWGLMTDTTYLGLTIEVCKDSGVKFRVTSNHWDEAETYLPDSVAERLAAWMSGMQAKETMTWRIIR